MTSEQNKIAQQSAFLVDVDQVMDLSTTAGQSAEIVAKLLYTTNPKSNTPDTAEAGAWQVSADSIHFGLDLRRLVLQKVGSLNNCKAVTL